MKRLLAALLTFFALLALTGCGGPSSDGPHLLLYYPAPSGGSPGGDAIVSHSVDWAANSTLPAEQQVRRVVSLLLEESAQDLLSELPQKMELNPGCALCLAPAGVDLEAASEYFDAHEPGWDLARLRQAQAAGKPVTLPRLVVTEGRYLLVQPGN